MAIVQTYLINKESIDILLKTIEVLKDIINIRNFLKGKVANKETIIQDQVKLEININGNYNSISIDKESFDNKNSLIKLFIN